MTMEYYGSLYGPVPARYSPIRRASRTNSHCPSTSTRPGSSTCQGPLAVLPSRQRPGWPHPPNPTIQTIDGCTLRTRQFGFILAFAVTLLAAFIGYRLNGGHPSVPWALSGAVVGTATAVAIRLIRGK